MASKEQTHSDIMKAITHGKLGGSPQHDTDQFVATSKESAQPKDKGPKRKAKRVAKPGTSASGKRTPMKRGSTFIHKESGLSMRIC